MKIVGHRTIPIVPALGQNMRVLVAEDNTVVRVATRALLLSRWRLDLKLVEDGEQALKAAVDIQFDLVLMDLQMPLMNGFDATLGIRSFESENPTRRRTPVVAYTSSDPDDIAGQVREAGIDAVLKKPCAPHEMCQLLHQWGRGKLERVRQATCDRELSDLHLT